jgi:hypothetical protein
MVITRLLILSNSDIEIFSSSLLVNSRFKIKKNRYFKKFHF